MATELINSASDEYIHTLLSADSNVCYVIPKYQREYSWGKSQWEALLKDIQEEQAGRGHFLGTIICINTTTNVLEPRLELVDGQQRMTTISILLSTICELLGDRRELITQDDDYQQKWLNLRSKLVKSNRPRLHLQVQGGNSDDYVWLLKSCSLLKTVGNERAPHYWGIRRIARAHNYFHETLTTQIRTMDDEAALAHLFELVDRLSVSVLVKLEVKDHASAFTLFESLNNRGPELSPIDLIKNSLLAKTDRDSSAEVDDVYARWMAILTDLGPSAVEQERFLRYYYNVFDPVPRQSGASPIATRSNLIRLYEDFLNLGIENFLLHLEQAAHEYGRIIGTADDEDEGGELDRMTTRLQRAQGAPGNALLMYLLVKQNSLGISEGDVVRVAESLTRFFVRRNLTGLPATYELPRLFTALARQVDSLDPKEIVVTSEETLRKRSSSDDTFRAALEGPIYDENSDMCRFILTALAEESHTKENSINLWERAGSQNKRYYVWTIEHIFPQGERIPDSWVSMLGGPEKAEDARETHVHRLGNLTLTGYNSTLGNKSFADKRDRIDSKGNPVGYRNGLNLNQDLKDLETWSVEQIDARTASLVDQVMSLFALR